MIGQTLAHDRLTAALGTWTGSGDRGIVGAIAARRGRARHGTEGVASQADRERPCKEVMAAAGVAGEPTIWFTKPV
jgi:hypothetical protein